MRLNILILTVCWGLDAASYEIRPAGGSRFALEVAKTGFLSGKTHIFEFSSYQGTLEYDPADPSQARVELKIDAASIACKDTWISASDLKKVEKMAVEDMLDVKSNPEILFRSGRVTPLEGGNFTAEGDLVIGGQSRPAIITLKLEKATTSLLAFSGASIVRLKDYGLKPPSAALGTIGTKNEMKVVFRLQAFGTGNSSVPR